jgi:hypothetical protein
LIAEQVSLASTWEEYHLLQPVCLVYNGLSLTANALVDMGANGYIFVNMSFADKIKKFLPVEVLKDPLPVPVGGYKGSIDQEIEEGLRPIFSSNLGSWLRPWFFQALSQLLIARLAVCVIFRNTLTLPHRVIDIWSSTSFVDCLSSCKDVSRQLRHGGYTLWPPTATNTSFLLDFVDQGSRLAGLLCPRGELA